MNLFDKHKIANVEIKNRIIRSATNEKFGSEDGLITDKLVDIINELAINDVGIIITAHYSVSKTGRADINQPLLVNDDNISTLKKMADIAHQNGSKLIVQLSHGGPLAPQAVNNVTPKGPSKEDGCEEMTESEIKNVIDSFADSACLAKEAGCDGVQVHCAHGYLLSSFIDPARNNRNDEYGGSVEKRCQMPIKIIQEIRKECGNDFLIFTKLNCDSVSNIDYVSDLVETAKLFEQAGVDFMELSGLKFKVMSSEKSLYYIKEAKAVKNVVKLPIALVGGIYDNDTIGKTMETVDMVSFSRPFICEPDLAKKLKEGQSKAKCIRCNKCYTLPIETGKRCVFHE